MKKPHLYLDCDEVLLKTAGTHALFLEQQYDISVDQSLYPSQWSFPLNSGLDFKKSTENFIKSDYFANIPAMPNAVEAVKLLCEHDYTMSIVSSISSDSIAQQKRISNLYAVFGNSFYEIQLLPLGWANKIAFYQSKPHGIVIDDSIFNIQDAIKCGHEAVFIRIPQNKSHHELAKQQCITSNSSLFDWVKNQTIKQR